MDANQLRIGNLVYFGIVKEPIKILSINPNSSTIEMAEPIPLSEEWLLKFGFGKMEMPESEVNEYICDYFNWTNFQLHRKSNYNYFLSSWSDSIIGEIKYVHTLQNIFYCLTGGELTIT